MNKVILIGNLTKDIETRFTSSNKAVANTSIAVKRDYKNANGEYESDFINCIAFDKTAELIAKHLGKGSKVCFEGKWQTGSYEKDGKKIYTNDMLVNQVYFLDSKKTEETDLNKKSDENCFDKEDTYKDLGNSIRIEDINIPDDLPF